MPPEKSKPVDRRKVFSPPGFPSFCGPTGLFCRAAGARRQSDRQSLMKRCKIRRRGTMAADIWLRPVTGRAAGTKVPRNLQSLRRVRARLPGELHQNRHHRQNRKWRAVYRCQHLRLRRLRGFAVHECLSQRGAGWCRYRWMISTWARQIARGNMPQIQLPGDCRIYVDHWPAGHGCHRTERQSDRHSSSQLYAVGDIAGL